MTSLTEAQQKKFREILEELPRAELFSEVGGEGLGIEVKASEEVDKLAKEKMDKDEKLSLRQAYEQVFAERPDLQSAIENE